MLETLINLGVCYYKLGLLDESLCCFENCLVNLRNNKQIKKKNSEVKQLNLNNQVMNNKEYQIN